MYLISILHVNGVLVEETTINFQFGYIDDIIQMQRSVINFTGNTRGKYKNKRTASWNDEVDEPASSKNKKEIITYWQHIYIHKEINLHKN